MKFKDRTFCKKKEWNSENSENSEMKQETSEQANLNIQFQFQLLNLTKNFNP